MSTYHSASSTTDTLRAVDSYSLQGDALFGPHEPILQPETDDFGFDPPTVKQTYPLKMDQTYSPPEELDSPYGAWLSIGQGKDELVQLSPKTSPHPTELDRVLAQALPNASTAISRFGQVTPPRSNSESSMREQKTTDASNGAAGSERRSKRATKTVSKDVDATSTTSTNKKRRNTRKSSITATGNPEEDEKRRQSLEKNRLAAAKCRVNKKEKTEQLQRDSHDKAVHNAFLKDQIMRMKEEVQQMNALLLAHANCDGCKSPDDIQKHLSNLGNEFFAQQIASFHGPDYGSFTQAIMEMEHENLMTDGYFPAQEDPQHSLLNPPLPDFDRTPDFDVPTPMHTD